MCIGTVTHLSNRLIYCNIIILIIIIYIFLVNFSGKVREKKRYKQIQKTI